MKNSISKEAFKRTKERFQTLSLPLSFFALACIATLVLAFFFTISLVITIPFLLAPSFFALTAINTVANEKNMNESRSYAVMFRAYFTMPFRGGYRLLIGILKSILVELILTIVISSILSLTVLQKDPHFLNLIEEMKTITDAELLVQKLDEFLRSSDTLYLISFISSTASGAFGVYMFVHHVGMNSIKYFHNFLAKLPLPARDLNLVNKKVFSSARASIYKDYYSATWFLGIILLLGLAGGSTLAFFIFPTFVDGQVILVGTFVAFILLLFFIPYYLNVLQIIYEKHSKNYMDKFLELSLQSLNELKKTTELSKEKEEEILKFLESHRPEKDKNENEENPEK